MCGPHARCVCGRARRRPSHHRAGGTLREPRSDGGCRQLVDALVTQPVTAGGAAPADIRLPLPRTVWNPASRGSSSGCACRSVLLWQWFPGDSAVCVDRLRMRGGGAGAPQWAGDDARVDEVQSVEEGRELFRAAKCVVDGAAVVVVLLGAAEYRVGVGAVADDQVTARWQGTGELGQNAPYFGVVAEVPQDAAEDERDRLVEVECRRGLAQDGSGVA